MGSMEEARITDRMFSLEATIEFIDQLEKTVNDISPYTRRYDLYPFDTVAGQLLAKAFALSRSAILLIQHGYPDEAFGLTRSLYESSIYLRYITQDQGKCAERSTDFLDFGVSSKGFWFDLLNNSSALTDNQRKDIERYRRENNIPDNPKIMTQPWSGVRKLVEKISEEPHPTDADASTQEFRKKDRAIAYTDTSTYVHCTQPGLNSYTYHWKEPILIHKSCSQENRTDLKACIVIHEHLRAVVRYSLFGLNLASAVDLKDRGHAAADIIADQSALEKMSRGE